MATSWRAVALAVHDLVRHWRPLLATDVLYALLAFVVLTPLSGLALRVFLSTSGESVLADQDILFFVLSPVGVMTVVVVGGISLAIVALQQACLMSIALGAARGRRVGVRDALLYSARNAGAVLRVAVRILVTVLLIVAPFLVGAALAFLGLLTEFDINFYLTERPPAFWTAAAIMGGLALGLAALLLPRLAAWTYALPILLFEDVGPRAALRESASRARGHRWTLGLVFAGWLAAISLAGAVALGVVTAVGRWMVPRMEASVAVLVVALGALVIVWFVVNLLITFLQVSSFAVLVVRLYEALGRPGAESKRALGLLARETGPGPALRVPMRGVWIGLAVAALAAAGVGGFFLRTVRVEDDVDVVAHRGASLHAPENTLAAVERGLADGADQIEIDVQESADGEVVVMHDVDLMKVAGSPLRVWSSTADELRAVDIGSRFDPAFSDQRVPTLREVLELSRGRALVNIELKFYGFEERLEERTIDIVESLGMADQVVVMSLKYASVRKMRRLRPDWRLGLLTATAVGDLTTADVDFLAVNSSLATRRFLRSAHARGKDVYVWTVNDPVDMWHLISLGVDGVITDDPALARQVLAQRAELGSAERLLMSLALILGKPLEAASAEGEA